MHLPRTVYVDKMLIFLSWKRSLKFIQIVWEEAKAHTQNKDENMQTNIHCKDINLLLYVFIDMNLLTVKTSRAITVMFVVFFHCKRPQRDHYILIPPQLEWPFALVSCRTCRRWRPRPSLPIGRGSASTLTSTWEPSAPPSATSWTSSRRSSRDCTGKVRVENNFILTEIKYVNKQEMICYIDHIQTAAILKGNRS